jgi:hypothetical protein
MNPSQPIKLKYQPVFSSSVISKAMNEAARRIQGHKKKRKDKKRKKKGGNKKKLKSPGEWAFCVVTCP